MSYIPKVGEIVIVYGLQQKAKVASVRWDATFYDWIIELDWGSHGTSKVKLHDQNKIWYLLSRIN